MKINNVVRLLYSDCEPLYRRLADDVRDRFKSAVEARKWFYYYRVKALESFAMKIETGRVVDPSRLDDFFACTIVVPTISDLAPAEELISKHYEILVRKPKNSSTTHKRPYSFEFDDIRLYVKRRRTMSGVSMDLDELVFEIQVKTALQYAWGVATHDLIYKSDSVSWPKERIAFQVKAMLEHAELAISEASSLSGAAEFQKQDTYTREILSTIRVVSSIWEPDLLPTDMKRLAESVVILTKVAGISSEQLDETIKAEILRYGILPSDLSPYAFTVQAISNNAKLGFSTKLKKNKRVRIFIHSGMDLPAWCDDHPQFISIGRVGDS